MKATHTLNKFLVGTMSMAAGFGFLLSSCNPANMPKSFPNVKGSFTYKDPKSGAKGGLKFGDGTVKPWARVPYIDKDGNVIGEFEVEPVK